MSITSIDYRAADAETAFKKFLSCRAHRDLPWETPEPELREIFMAGWCAYQEILRQTEMLIEDVRSVITPLGVPTTSAIGHATTAAIGTAISGGSGHGEVIGINASPEAIYAIYPRKVGRAAALKAIEKAYKVKHPQMLLAIVQSYAAAVKTWPQADRQFIPHPATWFNQGRYDDDQKEWQRGYKATTSQFTKTHS